MEDRSKPPPGMCVWYFDESEVYVSDVGVSISEDQAIAAAWAFADRIRAEGERAGYARALRMVDNASYWGAADFLRLHADADGSGSDD